MIIRDFKGYKMSRDYELLVRLMRMQSIVCFVGMGKCENIRDVARTVYSYYQNGEEVFGVYSYICSVDVERFKERCAKVDLEFLVPEVTE